jgi:hypothetical protein
MPLSWNEIRHRAIAFDREWQGETRAGVRENVIWGFSKGARHELRLLQEPAHLV